MNKQKLKEFEEFIKDEKLDSDKLETLISDYIYT
jgi:hypothetical protein